MLEEALEASANVLERIPWVADPDGTLIENAVDVFARLRVMVPRKVPDDEEDFDVSDNEPGEQSTPMAENSSIPRSESEQVAENGSIRHEGAAQ